MNVSKNTTKKSNKLNEFEKEVVNYLAHRKYSILKDLVEELQNKHSHLKNGKKFIDLGYSRPSIIRKLNEMIDAENVKKADLDELKRYGIEVKDGRSVYLMLPEKLELKSHIDAALDLIEKAEDGADVSVALEELGLYSDKYVLDSKQLNKLITKLDSEDWKVVNEILSIVYDYIINKKIKPYEEKEEEERRLKENEFTKKLGLLMIRRFESGQDNNSLKSYVVPLLGIYKDRAVIDELKKDAVTKEDFSGVESYYLDPRVSEVVEMHKTELMKFRAELVKEGKRDAADYIFNIKRQAMKHLDLLD